MALKILVLTKNNPIEIEDVCARLSQAFFGETDTYVCSPQFIADMVAKQKKVRYLDMFYPALRAYTNAFKYADENHIDYFITVGCVDKRTLLSYDAVVGLDNPDIDDYKEFPQDMNTTEIELTTVNNSDILFNSLEEVLHFIRIIRNNDRKKHNEEQQLQSTTMGSDQ